MAANSTASESSEWCPIAKHPFYHSYASLGIPMESEFAATHYAPFAHPTVGITLFGTEGDDGRVVPRLPPMAVFSAKVAWGK